MRRVVTSAEMHEMDLLAIEGMHIPGLLLMENAGIAVAEAVEEWLGETPDGLVAVLCGKGNNGGDGMVAARHLLNRGYSVDVALIAERESIRGDARVQLTILESMHAPVRIIASAGALRPLRACALIVDALFGTGISGAVTGLAAEVIRWVHDSGKPVISVDVPSGLNSDDGSIAGSCIRADQTVTMGELKRGLLIPPGREMAGVVTVADISMPAAVAESVKTGTFLLEDEDVVSRLPERPPAAHKGDFGKVLVLAGSTGLTGAAALASMASLRCGCGLTVLGIPESLNPILEEKCTEVMTRPLPQTPEGTLSIAAEKEILRLIEWADVLAMGPGLSACEETRELIRRVVRKCRKPMVLDADGINAFEGRKDLLETGRQSCVLTPHYGELGRVTGLSVGDIAAHRIEIARETALSMKKVLVLKGAPTVIGDPAGRVFINATGNSGMATAGSGDVLTGIIAGFLGQRLAPLDAALCGVYCHGYAGDVAAEAKGERGMMAMDILNSLPSIFQRLENAE